MMAQYDRGHLFRNSRVGSSLSLKSYTSVLSALAAKTSGMDAKEMSMTIHHIRSVAISYTPVRGITQREMATYTGWKSTGVFREHYVTHIEAPTHILWFVAE